MSSLLAIERRWAREFVATSCRRSNSLLRHRHIPLFFTCRQNIADKCLVCKTADIGVWAGGDTISCCPIENFVLAHRHVVYGRFFVFVWIDSSEEMTNESPDKFEKLAARASDLLRAWAYDHPFEHDPDEAIETIAASCVPDKDKRVREVAAAAGLDVGGSGIPDDPVVSVEVLRLRLCNLLEEHLWAEWDAIDGEREIMDEFEDDLD